jgi:hypothetical protein
MTRMAGLTRGCFAALAMTRMAGLAGGCFAALAMTMAARKEKKEQAAIGFANRCLFLPCITADVVIARSEATKQPPSLITVVIARSEATKQPPSLITVVIARSEATKQPPSLITVVIARSCSLSAVEGQRRSKPVKKLKQGSIVKSYKSLCILYFIFSEPNSYPRQFRFLMEFINPVN